MAADNAGPYDGQLPTLETESLPVDSLVVGSDHRQRFQAMDKRAKVRGRALIFEQMRSSSDREKLPLKNITVVKDGHQEMEVMGQERSRKAALDDLKMKNIKTVLMKLLNRTGLGREGNFIFEYFQLAVDYPETLIISSTGKAFEAVPRQVLTPISS